jgi:hypothetical protein
LHVEGNLMPTRLKNELRIDRQKIDEAVLALLYLTLHDGCRAWKAFDWDAMNRLHEKGFIGDPVNRSKSVVFTEMGIAEAERLFKAQFVRK